MVGIEYGDVVSQRPWSRVAEWYEWHRASWRYGVQRDLPPRPSIDNRSGSPRIRGRDWPLIASPEGATEGCQDRLMIGAVSGGIFASHEPAFDKLTLQ